MKKDNNLQNDNINEENTTTASTGEPTKPKNKIQQQLDKSKGCLRTLQIFTSIVGILFFAGYSTWRIIKNVGQSVFLPYIIAITVSYIIVSFILILVKAKKNDAKQSIKKLKLTSKIIKLFQNLLFLSASILVSIDTIKILQNDFSLSLMIVTIANVTLLLLKIFITIFKLIITSKNLTKQFTKTNK